MIPLSEIDVQRIKDVRDGKLRNRGCGKTTERMVTLLSYVHPQNDGKQFLFIGENYAHVQDIYHIFFYWLQDCGVFCQYSPNKLSYKAELPMPPLPTSIMGRVMAFFSKIKRSPVITFNFTTAERVFTRGVRYDRIILDLTPRTYDKNYERIKESLWAENRWQ